MFCAIIILAYARSSVNFYPFRMYLYHLFIYVVLTSGQILSTSCGVITLRQIFKVEKGHAV